MSDVLVLSARYSRAPEDPTLVDELVQEIETRGMTVAVVAVGEILGESTSRDTKSTRREHTFRVEGASRFKKYIVLWPRAMMAVRRELMASPRPAMLVAFAPLSVLAPMVMMALRRRPAMRVAIVFDLFPGHQVQVGRIPGFAEGIFRRIEAALLKKFRVVTGMTPGNITTIRKYYGLGWDEPEVRVLPPWGYRAAKSTHRHSSPSDDVRMVFGGQLVAGRNMEALLEIVRLIRMRGLPLRLTVFSSGPEFERLRAKYSSSSEAVEFKERVSRAQYQRILADFHVGAIVTDATVTMPTFPSKIIDYWNARLRCFCLIEKCSDIESVVADRDLLHVNHFSTDEDALWKAEAFFRRCLLGPPTLGDANLKRFTVERAVDLVCQDGRAGTGATTGE